MKLKWKEGNQPSLNWSNLYLKKVRVEENDALEKITVLMSLSGTSTGIKVNYFNIRQTVYQGFS